MLKENNIVAMNKILQRMDKKQSRRNCLLGIISLLLLFIGCMISSFSCAFFRPYQLSEEILSNACLALGLNRNDYSVVRQSIGAYFLGPSFYCYLLDIKKTWHPPCETRPLWKEDEVYFMTECYNEMGFAFSADNLVSGHLSSTINQYGSEIDLLYCQQRSFLWIQIEYPLRVKSNMQSE